MNELPHPMGHTPDDAPILKEHHRCIQRPEDLKRVMQEIQGYLLSPSYESRIDLKFTTWERGK